MNNHHHNGITLSSHISFLFLTILISLGIHFLLLVCCSDVKLSPLTSTAQAIKNMPVYQELPPMHVEKLLMKQPQTVAAETNLPKNPDAKLLPDDTAQLAQQGVAEASLIIPNHRQTEHVPLTTSSAPMPKMTDIIQERKPVFTPRQDVVAITEKEIRINNEQEKRWKLPNMERIAHAQDLASSVELKDLNAPQNNAIKDQIPTIPTPTSGSGEIIATQQATIAASNALVAAATTFTPTAVAISHRGEDKGLLQFDTVTYQPLDDRLRLALFTWIDAKDPTNTYFRLSISRRNDSKLPVLPKDVVLIQDVSGSIGTMRLEDCKAAMKTALKTTLRAEDRFLVMAFRNKILTSANKWSNVDPETMANAENFIDDLRSRGTTDLFMSLRSIMKMPRDKQRPLIAMIVTDGEPTAGITETTRIIGEFTRMNNGQASVYSFGTHKNDPYFLDMLCYCNRGEATRIHGSRKNLEKELAPVFETFRNPVMKDLEFTFDAVSGSDVHPVRLTNLYADRSLELFGRCPSNTQTISCQIRGIASGEPYDAIFSLNLLKDTNQSLVDLRTQWAERCMFDYLAEYASNPSPELLKKINQFSKEYGVKNPYKK